MLRYSFIIAIITFVTYGYLYSTQPPAPITLEMKILEPTGYNDPVEVEVSVGLNPETLTKNWVTATGLKIFIPPAMQLVKGKLDWEGELSFEKKETFKISVITSLQKNLLYSIGAVVYNDMLQLPLFLAKDVYLEKNRGAAIRDDMAKQLIENPWLQEAMGFEIRTEIDEKGQEELVMLKKLGWLQPVDDLEKMGYKEARPNRLVQDDWMDLIKLENEFYFGPFEKDPVLNESKRKRISSTYAYLSGTNCTYTGRLQFYYGFEDLKEAKVEIRRKSDNYLLGSDYTGSDGIFSFIIEIEQGDTAGGVYAETKLWNESTDKVKNGVVLYAAKDSSYFLAPGYCYFGIKDFGEGGTNYYRAADLHNYNLSVRNKTENDGGYIPPEVSIACPSTFPCTPACYLPLGSFMKIKLLDSNTLWHHSHEFGHHVHFKKASPITVPESGSNYDCSHDGCDRIAFDEGWADAFRDWIRNEDHEDFDDEDCEEVYGLDVQELIRAALYDVRDGDADGEYCEISMSGIIEHGIKSGTDSIITFLDNIEDYYDNHSDIEDVKEVNHLEEAKLLLAATGDKNYLPKGEPVIQLFQNLPNPFNPTTAISFNLSGPATKEVRLTVFDIRGRVVKELCSGPREPGSHTIFWDGTNDNGNPVPSGVYFYSLSTRDFSKTRKMVIMK